MEKLNERVVIAFANSLHTKFWYSWTHSNSSTHLKFDSPIMPHLAHMVIMILSAFRVPPQRGIGYLSLASIASSPKEFIKIGDLKGYG